MNFQFFSGLENILHLGYLDMHLGVLDTHKKYRTWK